jgi:hypothetical protein
MLARSIICRAPLYFVGIQAGLLYPGKFISGILQWTTPLKRRFSQINGRREKKSRSKLNQEEYILKLAGA